MFHNCHFNGNKRVAASSPSSKQTNKQLKGAVGTKAPIEIATIRLLFYSWDKDLQDWHD